MRGEVLGLEVVNVLLAKVSGKAGEVVGLDAEGVEVRLATTPQIRGIRRTDQTLHSIHAPRLVTRSSS